MKEKIGCRINTKLKNEYDNYLELTYGQKWGRTSSELEKAIKLYLTVNGCSEYMEDSSVQEMIKIIQERFVHTHKKNNESKTESNNDSKEAKENSKVEKLEHEIEGMRKTMDEMKVQLIQAISKDAKTEPKKERDNYRQMDQFVSKFQEEYGDHYQVSLKDISKLVMKTHRVTDKRSITNRIDYLVANEYIEPYAPNVYNIKPIISP